MKFINIASIFLMGSLVGCASMLPPDEKYKLSSWRGDLTFVKSACVLRKGQYTDVTGSGNPGPVVKFIAVTNDGATVGEWQAYCNAVVGDGTSSCTIFGPKKAYFECGNYDKYVIVN